MEYAEYLSLYYEAKTAQKISPEIKDYIDSRLSEIDNGQNGAKYNVVPSHQQGRLLVVDIESGSVVGNINPGGTLISVPIVYSDRVSFAVQDDDGKVEGVVKDLPDGNTIDMFRVGSPRPGMKYKEVMGRDTTDEGELPITPQEEPDEESAAEIKDAEEEIQSLENQVSTADATKQAALQKRIQQLRDHVRNLRSDDEREAQITGKADELGELEKKVEQEIGDLKNQQKELQAALQDVELTQLDYRTSAGKPATPITPANDTTSQNPYAVADAAFGKYLD